MRGLHLGPYGKPPDSTLHRLSSKSPGGVLLPRLEWLHCAVYETPITLTPFRLFLSPHLKRVILSASELSYVSRGQLAGLIQIFSFLPDSLEDLTITCGRGKEEPLEDAMSSFLCRSGSSLRRFCSNLPLSEAAIHHLLQLPYLRSWVIVQGLPQTIPPSIFPPLEELHLREQAALPWLHLLAAREGKPRIGLTPAAAIMNTNIKETLKHLRCPEDTPVDSTLLSCVSPFRSLVTLYVGGGYCEMVGICTFGLTDDDVENLTVTLPSLVSLRLGKACGLNSCRTTISSLLSISTHCLGLSVLEIHFNTRTIAGDIRRLLNGGSGRDEPRCALQSLLVGGLPLRVGEEAIGTVAMGFADIFPCLEGFSSVGDDWMSWKRVTSKLRD